MLGWLVAYSWARRRNRKLDEQAERQRQRAPEPRSELPDPRGYTDDDVAIVAAALPIAVLIVLGLVVNPWIFWVGLLFLFALIGFAS